MTENAAREPFQKGTQATKPSYYDLLELRPNASVQDIRRAYRDLSKLYHPDTTELESAIAIPKFQALNEAYATLSSPEKRLTYDYKTGFSRISVIQPLMEDISAAKATEGKKYSSNAYIDPTDRPLSAGEFFALFILGITFVACLVLVIVLSLTNTEAITTNLDLFSPSSDTATGADVSPEPLDTKEPSEPSVSKPSVSDTPFEPELPEQLWPFPEPLAAPAISAE